MPKYLSKRSYIYTYMYIYIYTNFFFNIYIIFFIETVHIVSSIFIYCQLSSFLPKKFNEELVRVYYKNTDGNKEEKKKKVEEAEKCFQMWCESEFGLH